LQVSGDVRLAFRAPSGSNLFTACFHSAFVPSGGIVHLDWKDLDKLSKKAKNICGPTFAVELLFAPVPNDGSPNKVVTV
jgi:phosphatidylinositol-3,4,5-trisphosphate 3-phosphatase/dual-specificity protein phosphatase PTEN